MNKCKSITKRILPLFLSATLCMGMVSGAFAADDPEEGKETEIESTVEITTEHGSEITDEPVAVPDEEPEKKSVSEQPAKESENSLGSSSDETKEEQAVEEGRQEDPGPEKEDSTPADEKLKPESEDPEPEGKHQAEQEVSEEPKTGDEKTPDQKEDEKPGDAETDGIESSDDGAPSDKNDQPEDGTKEDSSEEVKEAKEEPEKSKVEDKTEAEDKDKTGEEAEKEAKEEKETKKAFSELPKEMFIPKSALAGIDFSSARLLVADSIIDPENELSSYDGIHLMQYESPEIAKNAYAYYYGRTAFVEVDSVVHVANGNGGAVGSAEMTEGDNPIDELANTPAISGFDIALIDTGVNSGAAMSVSMIGDDTSDANGHGTQMAGIILSENPGASILSIKALGADGSGDISAVYAAIKYAIEAHVSIIHLSICAPKKADSAAIVSAVNEAMANGITVIAAAGNYGNNAAYYIPGGIDGVLTIGTCNEKGEMLGTSNYGDCVDFNAVAETTSQAAALFTGIYSRTYSAKADYQKIFPADYVPEEEPLDKWISLGIEEVDTMTGQQSESSVFKVQSAATIVEQEMYTFYDAAAPHLTDTSGNLIYCILPWSIAPNGVTANFNDYNIGPGSDENLMLMAKIMYYGYGGGGNILTGSAHEQEAITHFALSYVWLSLMGNTHGGPDWTVTGSSSLNATGQALVMNYINQVRNLPDVTGDLHVASLYLASGETYQDLAYGHFSAPSGKVRVKKTSSNTNMTDGNNCYSLQGAVFGLYNSQSQADTAASSGKKTGNEITTLTTNASGITPYSGTLDAGTYYLAEITAPKGYKKNTSVKSVTLSAGDEKEVSFADAPLNDPVGVLIEKIPQGTITSAEDMSEAQYEVKFYAGDNNGIPYTKSTLPSKASATWVIKTIKTSKNKYIAQLDDTHIVSGTAKYGKTSSGSYHIPLGTITIEEIKAPAGFMIKGSTMELADGNGSDATDGVILVNLIDDKSSVSVKSKNQVSDASDGFGIISRETQIRGGVKLAKVNEETDEPDERCEGTEIGIYADGVVYDHEANKTYKDGALVATVTVNNKGIASTKKDTLPAGSYTTKEISVAGPFKKNTTWKVSFFVTEDGVIVDKTASPLKNTPIRGGAKFSKIDAERDEAAAQGDATLEGAEITIYADETIIDGKTTYKKGDAVLAIRTKTDGNTATAKRALPSGKYYAQETDPSAGYKLNSKWKKSFTIGSMEEDDGVIVDLTDTPLKEDVIRGGVKFAKIDKENQSDKAQGWGTLAGAEITIYNNSENAVMVDGKLYDPGAAVKTLTTDKNGKCGTAADTLPYGTYYAKETTESDGYLLNKNWRVDFVIREDGVIVDTTDESMHLQADSGEIEKSGWTSVNAGLDGTAAKVAEQIKRADLSLYKIDIDGRKFAGIPFMISRLDENGNVVESHVAVTDANGKLNTKKLSKTGDKVNSMDALVKNGVVTDESKLNPEAGVWFGEQEARDNGKGSLIYANYLIEEIQVEANKGQDLLKQYLFAEEITPDGLLEVFKNGETFDLDNVFVNLPVRLESDLLDDPSSTKVVSLGEKTTVTDTVKYDHLKIYNSYKLDTEILYTDRDGKTRNLGHHAVTFKPAKVDATDTSYGTVSNQVTVNTKGLSGGSVSAVDTLYLVTDDGDIKLVTHNSDLSEERQILFVPWMGTQAQDSATKDEVGAAVKDAAITDTVLYENLADDQMYLLEGTLRFADTGEVVTGTDGNPCVVTKTLRISWKAKEPVEKSYGTLGPRNGFVVIPEFHFNAEEMAGKTLVVTEVLYDYDTYDADSDDNSQAVIIEHNDLDDQDQTIFYPDVKTSAVDEKTKEHVGAMEQSVIVDTVTLSNLVVGKTYTVTGKLMDKKTGKAIKNDKGEDITSKTEPFEATDTEMTVELTFETGRDNLAGRTLVVFEDLLHNDVTVAAHADLEDEDQSVHYPKIHTTAVADDTKDHVTEAKQEVTVTDTVAYMNLVPGKKYKLEGVLVDQANGSPIKIDGKEITAETEFTPEKENGTVEMTFTFDASALAGTTTVVFETMYFEEVKVAVHADVNDKGQTVYIPEIKTSIKDALTQIDHTKADEKAVVIDTVTYKNLCPGKEYVMKGVLVNKATGEPVTINGAQITAEQAFTPKKADGTVNIEFTFNASVLQGETIVAFERCYYNDIEVAIHADIEDEDQTDYIPEIGTTAIADDTMDHIAPAAKRVTIIDTVAYKGLKANTKYTVSGTLMDQKNGQPVTVNGQKVTGSTTFVTGDTGEGTVEVKFTFNASVMEGTTVVVFEKLYREDKLVAVHEEITDEGQSVHIPEIHTTAFDTKTEDHDGSLGKKVTIQDNVYFSNLIPGKQYKVTGKLMDKETGKEFLVDKEPVTAEAYFTPKKADGYVVLKFSVDPMKLAGKTLVAFEEVSYNDIQLAIHADINDKDQSVRFIEIRTTAVEHDSSSKEMAIGTEAVLTDIVFYKNLTPGKEYILKGEVMDKETGKGIGVTSEVKFQPGGDPNGDISVDFVLNTEKLQGKTLVVFEKLYDLKGNLLAEHEDLDDEGQTVTVPVKPETPKKPHTIHTGDGNNMVPWFLLMAGSVAAGAAAVVVLKKKRTWPGSPA
ncbi:MAG: VaFE repeat-containing surface-anchored protein [Lachnospiraceae bacterium]|nr:VaFE repeat-containing surface-anchored protein [Lachnospiraceae bacterium]